MKSNKVIGAFILLAVVLISFGAYVIAGGLTPEQTASTSVNVTIQAIKDDILTPYSALNYPRTIDYSAYCYNDEVNGANQTCVIHYTYQIDSKTIEHSLFYTPKQLALKTKANITADVDKNIKEDRNNEFWRTKDLKLNYEVQK